MVSPVDLDLAALRRDWQSFANAVSGFHSDQTLETFRKVNQTLGFNLAKAVPALLLDINRKETTISQLNNANATLRTELTETRQSVMKAEAITRALQETLDKTEAELAKAKTTPKLTKAIR